MVKPPCKQHYTLMIIFAFDIRLFIIIELIASCYCHSSTVSERLSVEMSEYWQRPNHSRWTVNLCLIAVIIIKVTVSANKDDDDTRPQYILHLSASSPASLSHHHHHLHTSAAAVKSGMTVTLKCFDFNNQLPTNNGRR